MPVNFCQLCGKSEETEATGSLLTVRDVSAHLWCLSYSSNLWCRNSPEVDDFNGFAVEDVKDEIRRGRKLKCHRCEWTGATVGCEVTRCRRSYHYPCALEDGAQHQFDEETGMYTINCPIHKKNSDEDDSSPQAAGTTPRTYCLECEALNGNAAVEGPSAARMVPCWIHTPDQTHDSASISATSRGVKRKLNFTAEQSDDESGEGESEPPSVRLTRTISVAPSELLTLDNDDERFALHCSSDETEMVGSPSGEQLRCDAATQYDPEIFIEPHVKVENLLAPLEFSPPTSPVLYLKEEPLDEEEEEAMMESRNSVQREKAVPAEESRNPRVRQHQQFLATYRRKDKGQAAPGAAKQQGDGYVEPAPSEGESIIPSDVDSDSLLAPVRTRDGLQGRSASQVGSAEPENGVSVPRSRAQSRFNDSIDMPEYYRYAGAGLFSSPVSPTPPESNGPAAIMDSSSFWKNCNMAGCTEDFFADLLSEMGQLSERIRSEQATQEDYDVAMKVMEASGRLALLVGKKQKELDEKEAELKRAQVAMKTLASAVKR